eukprot:13511879-Alexandrium_andersonii.AAC.1
MHRDALSGSARRQGHELLDALCVRAARRISLPGTAISRQLVRVQVRVPDLVALPHVVTTVVGRDAFRQARPAPGNWAAPACVRLGQVGELLRVKVVELADITELGAVDATVLLLAMPVSVERQAVACLLLCFLG